MSQNQLAIDRDLNLVLPIKRQDATVYVHSTPISLEVFKQYHRVLARTHAQIYRDGADVLAGPRTACWVLEDVSRQWGLWDGVGGVEHGLLGEIIRLSNVLQPAATGGWEMDPLADAFASGRFTPKQRSKIENLLVFFTLSSHILDDQDQEIAFGGMTSIWHARTSYLSCSEYLRGLPTSTEAATSGGQVASSVPS